MQYRAIVSCAAQGCKAWFHCQGRALMTTDAPHGLLRCPLKGAEVQHILTIISLVELFLFAWRRNPHSHRSQRRQEGQEIKLG